MATVQHAPLGAVTVLRVVNLFYDMFSALRERHEAKITRRELSRLTEQQLRDIGLTRDYVDTLRPLSIDPGKQPS
jgi:uncharacterized protein YjiS (DUF1127 family)